MYKSGMTAAQLFSILREDVDIALSIGDGMCVLWLNAVQQMYGGDPHKFQPEGISHPGKNT